MCEHESFMLIFHVITKYEAVSMIILLFFYFIVPFHSEHSSQRTKRVANNVSSYGRDMVKNGLGFMHSVSLKSHGPFLLSMKLLPYPVNQSCFPSALDKLNETALRHMVPAVTSLAN